MASLSGRLTNVGSTRLDPVARPRTVLLLCTRRGDDLVVAGSNGGNPRPPSWWLYLLAAGEAEAETDGDRWAATARRVGGERERCWTLRCATDPDFASHQELTDRRIPVVVLEREADPLS